jgi:hypothetical protein
MLSIVQSLYYLSCHIVKYCTADSELKGFCIAQEAVFEAEGSRDDNKVLESMLSMVQSLAASTEYYLSHSSISSQGGFALAINGIKIFKVQYINVKVWNIAGRSRLFMS